jgi:hypothetical protein
METKTLTQMMVEYRLFTDKIEEKYQETKMRNLMGGDRGVHLGYNIKQITKVLKDECSNVN